MRAWDNGAGVVETTDANDLTVGHLAICPLPGQREADGPCNVSENAD